MSAWSHHFITCLYTCLHASLFIPNCYWSPHGSIVQFTLCSPFFLSSWACQSTEWSTFTGGVCGRRGHLEVLLVYCSHSSSHGQSYILQHLFAHVSFSWDGTESERSGKLSEDVRLVLKHRLLLKQLWWQMISMLFSMPRASRTCRLYSHFVLISKQKDRL